MSKPTYEELEQRVKALEQALLLARASEPAVPGEATDMTVLKEAETKLRESEEKFRLAFHTSPDSINLNRVSDGKYIDVNEGFTKLMGYTREEVIGKTSLELNIWVESEDRERLVYSLTTAGFVENLEARFRRKNGQIGIGLMSARVLYINQENVILSVTRDITERNRSEELLRESERRYRTLFERTKDAIFIVDRQTGRYLDANAAAVELTGRPLSELTQLTTQDVCPEGAETRLAAAMSATQPLNFGRVTYIRPDGVRRITLLNLVPLDDEKVFGMAHDITNELELEERFRQAQKMEAIGRLAGGVAHDFNNLLVPIIGYAELAMMELSSDDPVCLELGQIKKAAQRAADLTRQILAFGRKQVLEMQVIDLNEVIRDFQQIARRLIREDIELRVFLAPSPGRIRADRAQLEQVLMNLVVNAGDAMPTGGTLTLETASTFLDKAYFGKYADNQSPGHYAMLVVSDTGHGMDAETQKHIFEPFYTTKEQGKGVGLGLATVFGIVKQHQGHIWVYSEPGKGTTFKVYLPQSEDAAQPTGVAEVEPVSECGTETILVVEDEELVRKLVCETLTTQGYRVIEASSPADALKLAADCQETLHLLLTDVIMPTMNGPQLHQKLTAIYPGLKVLFMSGYTNNVIVHHGILDEGVNFLQKPFTIQSLSQKVRKVLNYQL
jgi:PAS domain S-box-containing protein